MVMDKSILLNVKLIFFFGVGRFLNMKVVLKEGGNGVFKFWFVFLWSSL